MSIKKLKNRTEQAKEIQKKIRSNEEIPKIKANIESDREIKEHEDHLVHFDFIHHSYDRNTGKDTGVWNKGQKCYPKEWPLLSKSLEGQATQVILIHHPDKQGVPQEKKQTLTEKQQLQKDYTDLLGYEPEEAITVKELKESIDSFKEVENAIKALSDEGEELKKPITLEEAKSKLEELQNN